MQGFSTLPPVGKALAVLVGAVLVAALWSLIASVVFLAAMGMLQAQPGIPVLQWWQYWRAYGFQHPTVGLWLQLSAGIATALPVLAMVAMVLRGGTLGPKQALHGTTRWANEAELKGNGFREKFRGAYVGMDRRGKYLRYGGPEHIACYAPTRSGKGVGLVIPNCLLYESSLVCLDVKKENFFFTAGIRAAAGQKVFLFDPLNPDGRTARYNPLTYVRRGTIDTFDDIQRISQMLFPEAHGDNAFWENSARSAFVGATAFIAETEGAPLNMAEVLRLLTRPDGPTYMLGTIEAARLAGKPYTEATVSALSDYLKGSADLVNSVRKSVTAKLGLWFNPRIQAATAESDFDLRELRNSLHAIYVGVTPDTIKVVRPLLALFFQQLVDLTVRTLPQFDPRAKHQVLVLLDEFPLLGPMPVLAEAFAYVAGYNMRMMLIMQSKAQLRDPAVYGPDKATAILDNCGIEVVFGTKDQKLAEELSARLGNDTVRGVSRSGPLFWRALRSGNQNATESDQSRALLLPQEVTRLPPEQAIIVRPGMYPIRTKRIVYWNDPHFNSLIRSPPEVRPIDIEIRMDTGPEPAPVASVAAAPAPAPTTATSAAATTPAAAVPPSAGGGQTGTTKGRSRKTQATPGEAAGGQGGTATAGATEEVEAAATETETAGSRAAPPPAGDDAGAMLPHQSDGLIAAILGTDVDLTDCGITEAKAHVAAVLRQVPTPLSKQRKRMAAE